MRNEFAYCASMIRLRRLRISKLAQGINFEGGEPPRIKDTRVIGRRMGPIRGIKYRGHEIRLIAWPIPNQHDYSAMYEIRATVESDLAKRGKVPGTLASLEQAELAALKSAIRWIDQTVRL